VPLLKRRAEWGAGRAELALLGIPAIPEAATRAAWKTKGVELLAYVPDDTWLARVHGAAGPETNFMHGLTLFQPLDARLRLDPALFESTACEAVPAYVYLAVMRMRRACGASSLRAVFPISPATQLSAWSIWRDGCPRRGLTEWATFVGDNSAVQYVARGYGARLMNPGWRPRAAIGIYVGRIPCGHKACMDRIRSWRCWTPAGSR
jgi:hypothetical protein